ncbi:hypothetical protein JCM10213_008810 [Rhodosporidiobolus nylandii]
MAPSVDANASLVMGIEPVHPILSYYFGLDASHWSPDTFEENPDECGMGNGPKPDEATLLQPPSGGSLLNTGVNIYRRGQKNDRSYGLSLDDLLHETDTRTFTHALLLLSTEWSLEPANSGPDAWSPRLFLEQDVSLE